MSPNSTNERQLTPETEKTFSVLLTVWPLTESKTEKPDIVYSNKKITNIVDGQGPKNICSYPLDFTVTITLRC